MGKKADRIKCIAYLSSTGSISLAQRKEDGQLIQIQRYARKHNLEIVDVVRRNGFGWQSVIRQFEDMAFNVGRNKADVVLIVNSITLSTAIVDRFRLAGIIQAGGGKLMSVDEGEMTLPLFQKTNNAEVEYGKISKR